MHYSSLMMVDSTLSQVNVWRSGGTHSLVAPVQRASIGGEELCLQMADGDVAVTTCQTDVVKEIWRNPADWQVQEAFFSDLDRDGVQELALLAWRAFEPWPVDSYLPYGGRIDAFQDEQGNSCHLILISLADGNPEEIWAGSALANPIHSLVATDLDGDDQQELAAIEYAYDTKALSGPVVVWQWNGFGFSLVDRAEGEFSSLSVFKRDSSIFLLALKD
jgi:hypothetical protein